MNKPTMQFTTATNIGGRKRDAVKPRAETHGERLARLAAEADDVTAGDDLGKLSREERRKQLFG